MPGPGQRDVAPAIGQIFDYCYLCSLLIIGLLAVDTLALSLHRVIRAKQYLTINMAALVLQIFVLIGSVQMVSYTLWWST